MDKMKGRFTAYLAAAIKNRRINYDGKNSRRTAHEIPGEAENMGKDMAYVQEEPWHGDPAAYMSLPRFWEDGVQSDELEVLLESLGSREREIVLRRALLGQEFTEIGKASGLSEKQAQQAYYYAIRKMRRQGSGI